MRERSNFWLLLLFGICALLLGGTVFGYSAKQLITHAPQLKLEENLLTQDVMGINKDLTEDRLPSASSSAEVTEVVDGDTIKVKLDGQQFTVRLIGVDTPETVDPRRPDGCYGKEASDFTKQLLAGKRVNLIKDVSETDRYGRLLRYVYLQNIFVNDYLIRQGFAKAVTYPPDVEYSEQFKQAEEEARLSQRGLWLKCN